MNSKAKARKWRNTQLTMAFISGPRGAPLKASPPLSLNTPDDVLWHVYLAESTAVAVPSSTSNSQLRPPSLIADAPLKLWLKLLDFETLEALYNKYVVDSIMRHRPNLYRFSNPQLVALRREYFRRLVKAKLLNTLDAPAAEVYLKRLDEELARRKITIHNPELK